jgi:hypothetical protein
VPITVQENLLSFIEKAVTIQQFRECHFRFGAVHQTLTPACERVPHHLFIGTLPAVLLERVRVRRFENAARLDAFSRAFE